MDNSTFSHFNLRLIDPPFGSLLTDLVIELDFLRKKQLSGTTPVNVFSQMKYIFHTMESIGSARIEGNNTTIAEYIDSKLSYGIDVPLGIKEIQNIENVMNFIEENIKGTPLNRYFLSEMHKILVHELPPPPNGEGDRTPGIYRTGNVKIIKSAHVPPDSMAVNSYMDELFSFINHSDPAKYDLLKTAIAHHRFVWIHPFNNGNGRLARLFTYAMLVQAGFNVNIGRIINPVAVFCINRNDYYNYLSIADKGTDEGILSWCSYVLAGLKSEIEKIDRLTDYNYLKNEILLPAVNLSYERNQITELENKVLKKVIELKVVQAGDLKEFFPGKINSEISRQLRKLIGQKILAPEKEGTRKYSIRFDNNFLLRNIIQILDQKGFLPLKNEI